MKKIISLLSVIILVFSLSTPTAFADEKEYKQINITAEELSGTPDKVSTAIQSALSEAKDNATVEHPYKINLPSGIYQLNKTLFIYSNTELHLNDDTVLIQTAGKGENLIKAGAGEINNGYDGYKNITIDGGTWNMNFNDSCAMRFGHCTNLNIKNANVCNTSDAHHIEAAAIDNMNITNCIFTSDRKSATSTNSCESIQLDILHDNTHFTGYGNFDDTPNKNITITGCTFTDIVSGIGTRSGVVGKYFDNITITNNKFNNVKERAISCFNYKNSNISNNTFIDCNEGIVFEYSPNVTSVGTKRFYNPNSGAFDALNSNANTVISGNTINVSDKNSKVDSYAVYVYGAKMDSATAKKYGVKNGDYTIDNLTITNNNINCTSNTARGISITGVNQSEVTGNYLYNKASAESGVNGINICSSEKNDISSNVIEGKFNNAVSLYDNGFAYSKNTDISSNIIKGVKEYGIRIANGSFATITNDNSISLDSKTGKSTLCIVSEKYNQNIGSATVKSTTFDDRGKPVIRLSDVKGNDGYKVYRAVNGGSLKPIATLTSSSLNFEDKSAPATSKNYYRIYAYKTVKSSVIVGTDYVDATF